MYTPFPPCSYFLHPHLQKEKNPSKMMNPNTQFFILKPLYFRITNSYIIIFYLLAQITSSLVDPKFTACAPKTCPNNNQSISFPFYIQGTQQPYYGSAGFEISCAANGSPTLNLSHTQYLIRFGEKAKKTPKRIPGSVSASSEMDSRIRCSEKKRKQILYSVSAFCETNFTICFGKKIKLKRNVCSVSAFCETDFTIRFDKKNGEERKMGPAELRERKEKGEKEHAEALWENGRRGMKSVWRRCGRRAVGEETRNTTPRSKILLGGAWNLILSALLGVQGEGVWFWGADAVKEIITLNFYHGQTWK